MNVPKDAEYFPDLYSLELHGVHIPFAHPLILTLEHLITALRFAPPLTSDLFT